MFNEYANVFIVLYNCVHFVFLLWFLIQPLGCNIINKVELKTVLLILRVLYEAKRAIRLPSVMKRHVKVSKYDYFNAAQLKQFALRHTHIIKCLVRMTAQIVQLS